MQVYVLRRRHSEVAMSAGQLSTFGDATFFPADPQWRPVPVYVDPAMAYMLPRVNWEVPTMTMRFPSESIPPRSLNGEGVSR